MKRAIILMVGILAVFITGAQEVPQFTSTDYDGWTYNNPTVTLDKYSMADGKIRLYTSNDSTVFTLISTTFSCQGIDSITATVNWYTEAYNDNRFDLNRAALTLVIEDANSVPLDSVTCVPNTPNTRNHTLVLKIAAPRGVTAARMRFVSWTGDYVSCGAIKRAVFTTTATSDDVLHGDVDSNGTIDPADISALIDYLLNGTPVNEENADVNNDGSIDPSDISDLIDLLLNA